MNKLVICFVAIIMVLSVGVFANTVDVKEKIKDFVKVEDKDIVEVNFSDLPEEVGIENIENTSIVIYEVNYSSKPLFVITSTSEVFEKEDVVPICETRMLLSFGLSGESKESNFLNMVSGVESSLEKGYVVMRDGSVIGISTNLEISNSVKDEIVEVIIYKNGEEVGFRNSLYADSSGVKVDYDIQSKGIVNFKAGDVISVYLKSENGVSWRDATATVEITN